LNGHPRAGSLSVEERISVVFTNNENNLLEV